MTIIPAPSNRTVTYLQPLNAVGPDLHSISPGRRSLVVDPGHEISGLAMVQTLLAAGWHDEARTLLRQLTVLTPGLIEPWLQLFALDPSALMDRALLEAFVHQHPRHRVAQAVAIYLQPGGPHRAPTFIGPTATSKEINEPDRLGDYLVQGGWTTEQQVADAFYEQQRLRAANIDRRLGTIMLIRNYVTPDQLAAALRPGLLADRGELGHVLVKTRILPASQVAKALARQAMLAAAYERTYLEAVAAYRTNSIQRYIRPWQKPPTRQAALKLGTLLVDMRLLTQLQLSTVLREQARLTADTSARSS